MAPDDFKGLRPDCVPRYPHASPMGHGATVQPRLHVGQATRQVCEAALNARNGVVALRRRITGQPAGDPDRELPLRATNEEPSISDDLGATLDFLRATNEMLEVLFKELHSG